jgi:hypothetical protein
MSTKRNWNSVSTKTKNRESIPLKNTYVLWCHEITCKDWSLEGYTKLCSITNVSEFWKLFNNLNKLGYRVNNFFLMKDDIDPTWEHEKNRDGGICSLKAEINESLNIYEELCCYMICDILSNNPDDINGVSFCPKNNWGIIKIWNGDKSNDLSVTLNQILLDKYKEYSIKYTENHPEF